MRKWRGKKKSALRREKKESPARKEAHRVGRESISDNARFNKTKNHLRAEGGKGKRADNQFNGEKNLRARASKEKGDERAIMRQLERGKNEKRSVVGEGVQMSEKNSLISKKKEETKSKGQKGKTKTTNVEARSGGDNL